MLRAGDDGDEDDEAAGAGRRTHLALHHHHHHHRRGAAVHEGAAGELIWAIITWKLRSTGAFSWLNVVLTEG